MKRTWLVLLGLLLLAMPAAVQAQFTYTTNLGTITIASYTGSGGAVTIPSSVNGLPVTGIAGYAISDLFRTSITMTIPGSVTTIGDYAFEFDYALPTLFFEGNAPSIGSHVFFSDNLYGVTPTAYYFHGATGWASTVGDNIPTKELTAIAITANPTNGPVPLSVNFTSAGVDSASNAVNNWKWNFGDGSTSTAQNPSHAYTNGGVFPVVLIETNSSSLPIAGATASITVSPPTLAFTANPNNGFAPLAVSFTCADVDSAGNAISYWNWNFGDGLNSTAQNPSHTYTNSGTFSLALFATNNLGQTVRGSGPASISAAQAAQVQFSYTTTNGTITITGYTGSGGALIIPSSINSLPVTSIGAEAFANFTSLTSVLIPGSVSNIGQFAFEFCSGLHEVYFEGNAPAFGPVVFNQDSATGYYLPGATNWGGFFIDGNPVVELPAITITAVPTNGVLPLPVSCTAASVDAASNAVNNWNWTFGDGSTSTAQNPSHTYTTNGSFSVLLFETNNIGGLTAGAASSIAVSPLILAFTAKPTVGNIPLTVNFTSPDFDNGGNAIDHWNWTFGDGATSTAQNPSHTYAIPGTFAITLVATNNLGLAVTGSGPASITATVGLASLGLVLNGGFETGDFTGWQNNGDFSFTTVDNGSIVAPHSGNYEAVLGTTSSLGYLAQTLATTAGTPYALSFWLNSPLDKVPNQFLVSWNGRTIFDDMNIPSTGGWINLQFSVSATGTNSVLEFVFQNNTGLFGLDDISVVPVQPDITSFNLFGPNLVLNGINGLSGATYYVLMSTNLAVPLTQWTPVATNVLNVTGNFTVTATNTVAPNIPQRFYILETQ
jgi:PKD repeat protein